MGENHVGEPKSERLARRHKPHADRGDLGLGRDGALLAQGVDSVDQCCTERARRSSFQTTSVSPR
jgi:hypothetical protein